MLLKIVNLSKIFTLKLLRNKTILGCKNISFELNNGEFLVISGRSGSGKSTILKCIYRTYIPTSGQIFYNSKLYGYVDLNSLSDNDILEIRRKEMGYVSQFFNPPPRVTAVDLLAEPLIYKNNFTSKEAKQKAIYLLEKLNISPDLFDAYPSTFSGGEQQRINIARAIIWKPHILLLDEPTASLDDKNTAVVFELLRELKKEGTSIIGIFHDKDKKLVESIADNFYILD